MSRGVFTTSPLLRPWTTLNCWEKVVKTPRDIDFLGGRAATNYAHQLSNKASISQSVEFLPNFREQLDTTPQLSIGEATGANPILLVEVDGVRLLSDGRIAVVSGGEQAVLYFDAAGKLLRRSGRPGEGPGEFRSITLVGNLGDSLLLWDGQLDRATLLDPDGKVARTFTLVRSDTAGATHAVYRIDRARRAIPASEIDALGRKQGEQLTQLPADLAGPLRKVMLDVGVPATLPTAYQLVVDADGAVWLRDDVGPVMRDSIPSRWSVLDRGGGWLGDVTTPRRTEIHQITRDRVVGVWRDENDVEYVRIYGLRR